MRIQDDAESLLNDLREARAPAAELPAIDRRGSIPWLFTQWGGDRLLMAIRGEVATMDAALNPGEDGLEDWLGAEASTRAGNIRLARHILAWSETNSHRHVRGINAQVIEDFLKIWKDRRIQRRNIRAVLLRLFEIARRLGEIKENPVKDVLFPKRKRQKGGRRTRVETIARETVDAYAKLARTVGAWRAGRGSRECLTWPGGSRLIQLMYQTAADSTDVVSWRKGEGGHFVDDPKLPGIDFDRGKTGDSTFIPISLELAAEIRAAPTIWLVVDPQGRPYRHVVDDSKLRGHMTTFREYAEAAGLPRVIFDHLRHTAATEAVDAGVDIEKVKTLTTHKNDAMNRKVYVQDRKDTTIEIQRLRGIIN